MTDHHQVLVFGSFTEEEVRFLKPEPQKNDVQIIFGSLDSEILRSAGIFEARLTEPHSTQRCQFSSARKNVCRIPKNGDEKHQVALGVENGCSGLIPTDNFGQLKPSHLERASSSISSDCTYESQSSLGNSGSQSKGDFSFPSDGLVLNNCSNGNHQLVTKGSISNAPNGQNITPRNFVPRGLVNLGNLCFLNATLQALLSCSPFLELLRKLRNCSIHQIDYPTLHAFVEFISDFDLPTESICEPNGKIVLETVAPTTGLPFRPVMFDPILKSFTPDIPDNLSGRPRQEDAQEFLSFIMHQMHDELLKLDGQILNGNGKTASLVSSTDGEDEYDDWETVGPKRKTAITRTQSFTPSKLSSIFGGQLRSVVKAKGSKPSATVQPFLLLHLNICPDPVCTIEDALEMFSAPETVEGYRTSAGGNAEVVTASKSVKILELPEILVLHLMRFSYGSQGSTKLHKAVRFPLELVIGHELLASTSSEQGRIYELVATVTHHGRDPSKGHYTADAFHPNGQWLRYDDASVTPIPESKVQHDQAYVLFYRQL